MQTRIDRGLLFVIISSLGFGTLGLWAKWGYQVGFTPLSLLVIRFGLASLCLWIAVLYSYRRIPWPGWSTACLLVMQGGLGYALTSFSYFQALSLIPAGLASMLFYLHPIITSVLARLIYLEKPGREQIIALSAAFLGCALLTGGAINGELSLAGIGFALLGAAAYSGFTLLGQHTTRGLPPLVVTAYTTTSCFVSITLMSRPSPGWLAAFTLPMWLIAFGVALIATVGSILLYLAGVQLLGASRTAIISALEPVTGVVFAVLLLGERMNYLQIAGIALVLAAVWLLTGRQRSRNSRKIYPNQQG